MPSLTVGAVELYYELDGTGPEPIALLNGIAMTIQSWQPIRDRFAAHALPCLLHDFRGQLRSAKPATGPYSLQVHATDFLGLLDALAIDRVHLVGTSYGAEIAMVFAYRHPQRVASLTLIAATSELDGLMWAAARSWAAAADCGPIAFFRAMAPWAYSSNYLLRNRLLLRRQEVAMTRFPRDFFAAFKQLVEAFLRLDIGSKIARIHCPTLVISAQGDLIKGPEFGRRIQERIAKSEFLVIPDAGHAVVLEQPGQVAEHTIEFIKRHRNGNSMRR